MMRNLSPLLHKSPVRLEWTVGVAQGINGFMAVLRGGLSIPSSPRASP